MSCYISSSVMYWLQEETGRQVFRAVVKLYNSLMTPVPANVIDPIVKWIERYSIV